MESGRSPARFVLCAASCIDLDTGRDVMEAYTGFASVYDMFMDNIPYEEWGQYLSELLAEHGVKDGLVLDLG